MKQAFTLFFLVLTTVFAFAGNFTPGNIVVVRVGDGTSLLTSNATAVFLDEYTTSGTLVQSIPLPTSLSGNNHALTMSGKATSDGALTLSGNNQYLALAGFDTTLGAANVTSSYCNRTVGLVNASGVVNTSQGYLAGGAYSGDNFRGAVTINGTEIWTAGDDTLSTLGGTFFIHAGSFSAGTQISSSVYNTRTINIFNNQLYAGSASNGFVGVNTVGTDTPTTSGQTTTPLIGLPDTSSTLSPYAFWFFHENPNDQGVDVLYFADDETSAPAGGLYKYSLVNGTWVSNGNIPNSVGLRGITGTSSCTGGIELFLTDENDIYSFLDTSGWNGTLTGSVTTIVTSGTNEIFHGIAFTPGTTGATGLSATIGGATDITCYGEHNGSITIDVSGGNNYTYAWSDTGATTQDRNNLGPGTYTVTVTSGSCTATASTTILQPYQLAATDSIKNVSCPGDTNGSITLNITGGFPNYHWSPSNLTNLSSGTYVITVTDANHCTITVSATVAQPALISITDTVTNLPCTGGGNTGAVNIGVTGGTPGYTYLWSNSSTTKDISGLGAGTFTVTVTDHAGCVDSLSAIVSHSGNLLDNPIIAEVTCYGLSNGSITVDPSGGVAPYTFVWNNSDTAHDITNLAAGSYVVTIADNSGCVLISSITVSQPTRLVASGIGANVTCFGAGNGSIIITSSGGTPPYTFSGNDSIQSNLAPGIYTVTVNDNNGCSATVTDTITQPDSLSLNLTVINVTVHGGDDGSIDLAVSGGTPAYIYNWTNGTATQNDTGLTAASYCVVVEDHNGCLDSACATVSQPTGIEQTEWMQSLTTCTSGGNIIVNLLLKNDMRCAVALLDMTGKVIISNKPVTVSSLYLQWPAAGIASGCYLVRVVTDEGVLSRKIIVAK